jgi:aminoglycoside phosphotransferase (APT) family kinase protein
MDSAAATEPPDPRAVRQLLAEIGDDPGELELRPIEGGASRQTFVVAAGGEPRWVIRREPAAGMSFAPLGLELAAIAAADLAGVAVAPTVAAEPAGGRLGEGAGYLMEFVPGTSVAPRVLRRDELATARERLPGQLAAALAQLHSVPAAEVEGLPASEHPALEACDLWEAALDEIGEPLPGVEAGLRWLRLHAPDPPAGGPTLVHGDFRLGNLIVDERGLAAVIDWELCHAGDPAEDIAWLCIRSWRFGNDDLPVAGIGELEPFLDAYEADGGTRPDPELWRGWAAMGNVKWAVICARQAHDHLTGARPSAELASLGRRICEPEWDLLSLLADPDGSGREAEQPAGGVQ